MDSTMVGIKLDTLIFSYLNSKGTKTFMEYYLEGTIFLPTPSTHQKEKAWIKKKKNLICNFLLSWHF